MEIKFHIDPLAEEKNNYTTKIVNAYIVSDLDSWLRNPTNNFKLRNCLFGTTSIVRNIDKEKWVYSGYGIAFHEVGSLNFCNYIAKNVAVFYFGYGSSSHAENHNNNFLVVGDGSTYGINGSFGLPKEKFSITFSKANTKFC